MNKTIFYIYTSENNHSNPITEEQAKEIYSKAKASGIKVIDIESEDYPDKLRLISNPPLVLFAYGDIGLLKLPSIAIVGTRRASPYGRWAASEIARSVASCNYVHVSGMAEGIDSAGHISVLEHGGKTIAVLGTGVDICFPKSAFKLYESIK